MEFVLEPLAAAYAVLTEDEKELGVALIDIGAGSADVAVFVGESVRYTVSLDIAGNSITSDISKCLKVPISLSKAEEIKKKYGTCKINNLIEDETFPVPGVGDRGDVQCSRKLLARVITARVAEIFKMLSDDLEKHKIDGLINGGIVLTGGCCALEGIDEVVQEAGAHRPSEVLQRHPGSFPQAVVRDGHRALALRGPQAAREQEERDRQADYRLGQEGTSVDQGHGPDILLNNKKQTLNHREKNYE